MRNEMFRYDDHMASLIFDYCRNRLSLDPVPLDFAGDKVNLDAALAGLLGPEPNSPEAVLGLFTDHLAPAVISCDSPRFLAFIPAAPTRASLLFDMVVSCSSLQGSSWLEASGAIEAENQLIRLLADLAGLPPDAGGVFVSGGSAANLSALAVARDVARREGRAAARLSVAVSDQVHSSVRNTLRILDMAEHVVTTEGHRLDGSSLSRSLETDGGSDVVAVVATAGTTNAGIVDDLQGVGELARERDMWFHVDAAYGGAALFAPEARPQFRGIELADSLVIDPHKWLFAPFDCAGLVYRRPELAKSVHTQSASYLDPVHSGDEWNPS
ncbi:MAG: pyridoxal phosphate-dependent decarboxylase family protein, partial [Acidimicrobiales bacterium]